MRTFSKLMLAALAASAILAIAVSSANARSLSSNEIRFETIWNETLNEAGGLRKTKLRFTAGGHTIACRVTLLGDFLERTILKETARTQNLIFHGELESCEGGGATIRQETFPWPSRYRSFTGTLPRIRSVTIGLIGAAFRIKTTEGIECEAITEVNHPGVGIAGNSPQRSETGFEATGEPENITAEEANRIPLPEICALLGEGAFSGIGLIRNLPRTAKLRITLI